MRIPIITTATVIVLLTASAPAVECEEFNTFVSTLGPRNVQMFGAGVRSVATIAQNQDLYNLGRSIERWGEGLSDVQYDVGGGLVVGRLILAGEAARQFEEEGVDPYTAHVAAHRVIAPVMIAFNALGLSPEDIAMIGIDKAATHYLINDGTVDNLTLIMHDTVLDLMVSYLAENPRSDAAGDSMPEISEDAEIYPLDDENIMVVEPTYGNITIIEISPP